MTRQLEVECFFGPAYKVVFLLDAVQLAFKDVYGIHGGIGTHAPLHGTCLLPFCKNVIDLVLDDLVLCNDLELETGCEDRST